ncbi:MAG: hypothetical protein ACHQSE_04685 [Gemmatimonadales bacterium]
MPLESDSESPWNLKPMQSSVAASPTHKAGALTQVESGATVQDRSPPS